MATAIAAAGVVPRTTILSRGSPSAAAPTTRAGTVTIVNLHDVVVFGE